METLKYWGIANLELLALIVCCIIYFADFSITGKVELEQIQGLRKIGFYGIICLGIFMFLAKNGGVGMFVKTLALLFFLLKLASQLWSYYESGICGMGTLIMVGIITLLSLGATVSVAKYTYQNFDEVVSRRMLWRNSNVSLFEEQAKYTYDRFIVCWFSLLILLIYIISLFN